MTGRGNLLIICVFFAGVLIGLMAPCLVQGDGNRDRDMLFQVSTMASLMEGAYEGTMSYGDLSRWGDHGIGTFHGLDGEMIAIEGEFYQITADGSARPATGEMTAPFAMVTWFEPDLLIFVRESGSYPEFSASVGQQIPDPGIFSAVRITGTFPSMVTRSVPAYKEPYPRLVDAVRNQSVFFLNGTEGTLFGFWSPESSDGMSVPGFHLHYLTRDRQAGGHVLDFSLENATVELDLTPGYSVCLPLGSAGSGDYRGNETELGLVEGGR